MNIIKKWFGNGKEKQKTTFNFETIDTNIRQLSNDEQIKDFLFRNPSLREIYEAVMTNPYGTQMYAMLFDTHMVDEVFLKSLLIVVQYEISTQFGQLDLFMIENPVSKETNLYKIISYLEKSIDRNMNDIIDYLRTVIQTQINKEIKVVIDKTSNDGLSTENNLIYFSYLQSENFEEIGKEQKPELVIVMGGVCSGKTTFRKEKFANGYVNIDAGEIFIQLSQGQYYDFPSHLESEMNEIGLEITRRSLKNRHNIVIEIIGANQESVTELIDFANQLNYTTKVEFLHCEMDVAWQRNVNRENDNISAHYCEPYHINWFQQAANEYLNLTL